MYDVTALDKRMTAFVIPNAIQLTTRTIKYTFTSFLSRDTTFDVIYNVWRLARPEETMLTATRTPEVPSGNAGMRDYISKHQSEFIPEGVDAAAVVAAAAEPASLDSPQRSLQWAYDTFEGAAGVAKRRHPD